MSLLWYCTVWITWRTIYFVTNNILVICYWGRKKTVPPIKNRLLLKSAKELAKNIREGTLKSEEVVQAYIDRMKEVNPYINAIVEDRFVDALEEARDIDQLVRSGKFTRQQLEKEKPILGIPITVKCLLNVKGMASTACSKIFKDRVATEDSPSVTLMKNAGGIVLALTNAPEFGASFETVNLLYGRTRNPYDTTRTPGGSSGGESALLGAGASLIGLGNDMAGSVRVPAHFTGIFSHKPSRGIVPNNGTFPVAHPETDFLLYTGPMCRYSEDLVTAMDILTSHNGNKVTVEQETKFKDLKIYYATSNGDPMTCPADKEIVKAMHKAISHFTKNYNVTAKEVKIPFLNKTNFIYKHLFHGPVANIVNFISLGKMDYINPFLEFLKFLIGKSTVSLSTISMLFCLKLSLYFDQKNIPRARELLKKLEREFDDLLDENSIFIYPSFPFTAPHHYSTIVQLPNTAYTSMFNFVGLPVSNCPIELNKDSMPQGIQVIGKNNNDKLTLSCAVELEKAFGGWISPGVS